MAITSGARDVLVRQAKQGSLTGEGTDPRGGDWKEVPYKPTDSPSRHDTHSSRCKSTMLTHHWLQAG